jgi:hypothetical protein
MRAYRSLTVFCVYLFVLAVSGLTMPDTVADLLGMPHARDIWGRVAAVLVLNLAILYVWIVRTRSDAIIPFTVATRAIVFVAFTTFVATGMAPAGLAALGVIDALGGLWTLLALRQDRAASEATGGAA